MPNYGFDKVANLDEVKQRLIEASSGRSPNRIDSSMGIDPPRGILLYGPPGTGKTFVVRALAHEAGRRLLPGQGRRAARQVRRRVGAGGAGGLRPGPGGGALDHLLRRDRRAGTGAGALHHQRHRLGGGGPLTEMDGITNRGNVAVIGATNRADLIDPALAAGRRFETQIELGLPDAKARRALIDLSDVPFAPEVDKAGWPKSPRGCRWPIFPECCGRRPWRRSRADSAARQVKWEHLIGAIERWQTSRRPPPASETRRRC